MRLASRSGSCPTTQVYHPHFMPRRVRFGPDMSESRVIKRYANRKLYDTQHSRYVTLEQIAEMVREGEDVRIIDNTSKEDLTSVTLAQIILEEIGRASCRERV